MSSGALKMTPLKKSRILRMHLIAGAAGFLTILEIR